jgi:hypothetical protein
MVSGAEAAKPKPSSGGPKAMDVPQFAPPPEDAFDDLADVAISQAT